VSALRFLWSPGAAAAEEGRVGPAAVAFAAAAFAQGALMKPLMERKEFASGGGPPMGSVVAVAASVGAVILASWFMRTTLLELAMDWKRAHRNMRPMLRATAWLGCGAAVASALWAAVAMMSVPEAAPKLISVGGVPTPDPPPSVWILLVPFAGLWMLRAVWEGLAAAKLYNWRAFPAVAVAGATGLFSLVVAFIAVCSVDAGYLRLVESFKG
jgi:hypothetical protein